MTRLGFLMIGATLLGACETTITFDPFLVPEIPVEASWTVEGFAPDVAGCAALGVDRVRVEVFDEFSRPLGSTPALEARCTDGFLATPPLLQSGVYRFQLLGLDAAGFVVADTALTEPVSAFGNVVIEALFDLLPTGVIFDPFGAPEVSIDAAWTVNGFAADFASCGDAGIATVRIDVFENVGGVAESTAALEAPCEQAGLVVDSLLRAGSYVFNVRGLDASGLVVAESGFTDPLTAGLGQTFVIDTDLVSMNQPFAPRGFGADVTVSGTWSINGTIPDAALCGLAGIATVRLTVFDATETQFVDYDFPCAAGAFTDTYRRDLYFTQWTALDATGLAVTDPVPNPAEALDLGAVTTANLRPFDIVADLGPASLEITLNFENTLGGMDFRDCAGAGVATIGYELFSSVEGVLATEFGVPCANTLFVEDAPAADYTLSAITADGIDGTKWGPDAACATIGAFAVFGEDAGTVVQYDCFLLIEP